MKTPRIKLDDSRKEVFVNGQERQLAPAEYKILHALIKTGRALTREELGREIGHSTEQIELGGRVIDQHIARLRRKIGSGVVLTSVGHGYKAAAQYI